MTTVPSELDQVARRVHSGEPAATTVRTLLSWFRAQRRGSATVWTIKRALRDVGLVTVPSFENAWIDAEIAFRKAEREPSSAGESRPEPEPERSTEPGGDQAPRPPEAEPTAEPSLPSQPEPSALPAELHETSPAEPAAPLAVVVPVATPSLPGVASASSQSDPVHRVGKLPAANSRPELLSPGVAIGKATTLMLLHDLSQVPVGRNDYGLKGVVTWRSIGRHTALHGPPRVVDDCLEEASICSSEASVFEVAHLVHRHGYVLVRSPERRLQGLVTAKDLSEQFGLLLEPFLLIGEIEGHLRGLIDERIPLSIVRTAKDAADTSREIESAADLTFGEYKRLLEREEHWALLGVTLDRAQVIAALEALRQIRNDLMHFQPEGLEEGELRAIRELVVLLRELRRDAGRG